MFCESNGVATSEALIVHMLKRVSVRLLRLWYSFKKYRMKAVYDEDLLKLLASLDALEIIEKGKASCLICNNKIDLNNLAAIKKSSGVIRFICSDCFSKVL